jgi:hypothetical protein
VKKNSLFTTVLGKGEVLGKSSIYVPVLEAEGIT